MPYGQDEPIAVRPDGIVGIELEHALPEAVGYRRHRHRRSRMSGIRLLNGIHRKGADCVDTGLIELCVRHHALLLCCASGDSTLSVLFYPIGSVFSRAALRNGVWLPCGPYPRLFLIPSSQP